MQKGKAVAVTLGVVLGLVLAGAGTARAASSIVLPRSGQVGVGLQGQFGSVSGGDLGETFGSGAGLAVRLRYRMRYERGLGLSFESQSMDARKFQAQARGFPTQPDSVGFDHATVVTAGPEIYQMFGTRTRTVKMLSAGAGLAQITARVNDGETVYPINGDAFYLSAGAGVERFFYRSWAFDLSTRYLAIFHDSTVNHDVQFSAGLIFYASY